MESRYRAFLKKATPTRLIVGSFAVLVILGTVLLILPVSSNDGRWTPPVDALFTATSATCVTGLAVYDTYGHWSYFGQAVLLLLIQCGGLGIATFATGFSILLRRRIGIRELVIARESAGGSDLDMTTLMRVVLGFTLAFEALGALLLMIRFVPLYGGLGAWASVFVSVSAFCNAGFDILSFIPGNASLSAFNGDPLVTLTVAGLIITGSTGFVIYNDIYLSKVKTRLHRTRPERLSFHTQVCLRTTALLLVLGTLLLLLFEYDASLSGLSFLEKLNAAFFQSVNTRTAGFCSVDLTKETDAGKLVTILLMFVGGCPGSTAGGIKVTTLVVLLAAVRSTLWDDAETSLMKHRFDSSMVNKALTVTALGVAICAVDTGIISAMHGGISGIDGIFESVSAFATVGLTAGVTTKLSVFAKLAITATMFIGRVGPVSLGLAFLMRGKKKTGTVQPEGRMLVG